MNGLLLIAALLGSAASVEAGSFPATSRTELRQVRDRAAASQFLQRATFGPTWEEIDALAIRVGQVGRRRAFAEWIDAQLALPPTGHVALAKQMVADDGYQVTTPAVWIERYREHAWWHAAIDGEDQLRQRLAFALSQIFVISDGESLLNGARIGPDGEVSWLSPASYYDILVEAADETYRDTLGRVALHPAMGAYLSHARNRKADPAIQRYPDENFAREVMQLFSIGVNELRQNGSVKTQTVAGQVQPIETYGNAEVEATARVFTGLTHSGQPAVFEGTPSMSTPMAMFESEHDTDAKTILGGHAIPAGQSGMQDIDAALDHIAAHPNVGPFMARRLIQRFVKSNPSKWYVRRVADAFADNGDGVRGDWAAVLKAVLLDPEAIASQVRTTHIERLASGKKRIVGLTIGGRGTEWSKLREPVLRYTALVRAFDPTSDHPHGRMIRLSRVDSMRQGPLKSPSVFNFYLPDHRPAGELIGYAASNRIPDGTLYAPEFQILTPVSTNRFANLLSDDFVDAAASQQIADTGTLGVLESNLTFDYSDEIALVNAPTALLDRLDLLLCHGTMSDQAKQTIADAILDHPLTNDPTTLAGLTIVLVATSPDCAVTE